MSYSALHDSKSYEELEAVHGKVYTTAEATSEFEFLSFLAPFASVIRKSDRKRITLGFQHRPRVYWVVKEG